ncbi:dorsalin-1-like isoform X1 [Acropora palmata]|uniref:dorsalin-1-like isoform X1 n=1 Tax=Acropora palmata TaxID=6131 RepID=UPI003DA039B8
MENHLWFIVTIVVYSVANVYTNENLNVDETTVPVAGRGRESLKQIGDIPKFLLQMFLSYAKDDQRTKRYSKLPIPTVHGFLGQASSDDNGTVFSLTDSKLGRNEYIMSAMLRVNVEATTSLPPKTRLALYDQLSDRPIYTADFEGGGVKSVMFPVRTLVQRWIFSERPRQGVYFKLLSDKKRATNMSVQVIDGPGFQTRRNGALLIVKTLPTKLKIFEDMESLISPTALKHNSRNPRAAIRDEGPCSRRPMTVHFRAHLNMKQVIFPRTFESYRCGGSCRFPLDTKVNPTRHAIILAILYSRLGRAGGGKEPCCVPIKLRKITVFARREGHIKIQTFQDMIVEECGCR